jgi:hypothetical protein
MSFDFSSVLAVTLAAVNKGADRDHAAAVAFPVIIKSGATLRVLLEKDREHTALKLGVSAAYRALVGGIRAICLHDGVDVTDAQAVRHAIREDVWLDEGHAVRLENRKAKPATKTEPAIVALTPDELKIYQNVSARISRLARDVVDAPKVMPEKAKVRVPADAAAAIKALKDAGVTKAQMMEAIKRAFA